MQASYLGASLRLWMTNPTPHLRAAPSHPYQQILPTQKSQELRSLYLGSLLSHLYEHEELILDPWKADFLKHAFLGLGEHHFDQHSEHGGAHVVTWSVRECLLQVV